MESLVRHSFDIRYNFFLLRIVIFQDSKILFCFQPLSFALVSSGRRANHASGLAPKPLRPHRFGMYQQYGFTIRSFLFQLYYFTKLNIHKSQKLGKCGAYLNINLFSPRSSVSL